jgi:hypothetical protein
VFDSEGAACVDDWEYDDKGSDNVIWTDGVALLIDGKTRAWEIELRNTGQTRKNEPQISNPCILTRSDLLLSTFWPCNRSVLRTSMSPESTTPKRVENFSGSKCPCVPWQAAASADISCLVAFRKSMRLRTEMTNELK